jgi:hypothetical protein
VKTFFKKVRNAKKRHEKDLKRKTAFSKPSEGIVVIPPKNQ